MGLSASQTRFLTLTARKSNVEYQGQQINQARTALANQSSQLYTQMMSLDAPTAPSPYQFVINPIEQQNIDWSNPDAYPLNKTMAKDFMIYYAGNQPAFQDFNIPEYEKSVDADNNVSWSKVSYDEKGKKVLTAIEGEPEGTYCYKETGKDANGNEVQYTAINVAEGENFNFDIETGLFVPTGDAKISDLPKYIQAYNDASAYYSSYSQPTKTPIYTAKTDIDLLKDNVSTNNPDAVAYKSSSTLNINQAQYNAAMVQYEIDLKEYDKALEEINMKTEEIHEADKKLELQLKQLDTEQEAIQTEYEAVKKVIDKNIENTFKSFA